MKSRFQPELIRHAEREVGRAELPPIKLPASCFYRKSDSSKAESRIVEV